MIKNKILLPHQYYYPHMQLVKDRCNPVTKKRFLELLSKEQEQRKAMIYVHIPFCDSRCAFCGFDKQYDLDEMRKYTDKLLEEIKFYSSKQFHISSIHFGGGTPTIMPGAYLKEILDAIKEGFNVEDNVIVNIEGSSTTLYRQDIIDFIINEKISRVSTGVQTFLKPLREILNTKATLEQVYETLDVLKKNNIITYVDILYGYPDFNLGNPIDIVKNDIREAINRGVDGIDFSQVYPYKNALDMLVRQGKVKLLSSEKIIEIMQQAIPLMEENGYVQNTAYGFIKKGHGEIIIETSYFGGNNQIPDCIALGSGSFGFIKGYKYRNNSYNSYMNFNIPNYSQLKELTEVQLENMNIVGFPKLLSLSKKLVNEGIKERFGSKIAYLVECGLLEEHKESYDLTQKGKLYVDNIYYYLIEKEEKEIVNKELTVLVSE